MIVEHATIISLIVLAIYYTMLEGEIFGWLGKLLSRLPNQIHPALFECNVCMTPWYGSVIYLILYGVNWQWPVVVSVAMGMNVVINKWGRND